MDIIKEVSCILKNMDRTHMNKDGEYGNSFSKTYEQYGIISAIVRMSDKMERIKTLANKDDKDIVYESLEDNLIDLALYSVKTVAEERAIRRNNSIKCMETIERGCN